MFNNVAIDVALGLVFIFLVYSLLATILQELLSRWFGLRARTLVKALRRMLEDGNNNNWSTLVGFVTDVLRNFADFFDPLKKGTLLKAFYDHPSIKYLGENNANSKPSYINAETFSSTLTQLLRGEGYNPSLNQMQAIRNNLLSGNIDSFTIHPQTRKTLTKLWIDAGNDIDRFKSNLEKWFTETMNRASGWYKKQTQFLLFLIGWGLAVGFNVDPICIGKILANNEGPRKELVEMALNKQKKFEELVKSQKDSIIKNPVSGAAIPVRYVTLSDNELNDAAKNINTDANSIQNILGMGPREDMDPEIKAKYQNDLGSARIGWLLTALAISLGAAFWFDLLNKIISIRSAGTKPSSNDAARKSGQTISSIKPVG